MERISNSKSREPEPGNLAVDFAGIESVVEVIESARSQRPNEAVFDSQRGDRVIDDQTGQEMPLFEVVILLEELIEKKYKEGGWDFSAKNRGDVRTVTGYRDIGDGVFVAVSQTHTKGTEAGITKLKVFTGTDLAKQLDEPAA